nr:hypothetical protein Iba_chr12aCG12660 [Ipomoea batatas]GME12997.1 hypothetical protein Iba_scaffold14322CG0020 [Ipomoea batatas]
MCCTNSTLGFLNCRIKPKGLVYDWNIVVNCFGNSSNRNLETAFSNFLQNFCCTPLCAISSDYINLINPSVLNAVYYLLGNMPAMRCPEYGSTTLVDIIHKLWC